MPDSASVSRAVNVDRLARSVPDARDISAELEARGVALQIGTSVHDPTDAVGKLLFNALAMVAEFESDIIRQRTREGMAVAKARGRLKGKQPKLSATQEAHLVRLVGAGEHTIDRTVGRATAGVAAGLPDSFGELRKAVAAVAAEMSSLRAEHGLNESEGLFLNVVGLAALAVELELDI